MSDCDHGVGIEESLTSQWRVGRRWDGCGGGFVGNTGYVS